jgi:hypothetical protein
MESKVILIANKGVKKIHFRESHPCVPTSPGMHINRRRTATGAGQQGIICFPALATTPRSKIAGNCINSFQLHPAFPSGF